MKKVLFLCSSYIAGGAERAFVSLLNSLPLNKIEAHVMVLKEEGLFKEQLPENIIIKHAPKALSTTHTSIRSSYFWKRASIKDIYRKISTIIKSKLTNNRNYNPEQYFWNEVKSAIPNNETIYDVVISFMPGYCNYYAIEKVEAKKKILWFHNDYNKVKGDADYDRPYFAAANKVATISSICVDALIENFPELKEKFVLVENISPASLIVRKSKEEIKDITLSGYDFTISSIGRLSEQKGYDMAVEAARLLKEKGLDFCWCVIGEGELRPMIEGKIKEYHLEDNFKLIGLKTNPYPYIANSTMFVMTSRYEGKSIALDEAKILCKPILSTKYPSVYDNIEDGVNGILVEQSPIEIANGIELLYKDKELRNALTLYLKNHKTSNEIDVRNMIMNLIEE